MFKSPEKFSSSEKEDPEEPSVLKIYLGVDEQDVSSDKFEELEKVAGWLFGREEPSDIKIEELHSCFFTDDMIKELEPAAQEKLLDWLSRGFSRKIWPYSEGESLKERINYFLNCHVRENKKIIDNIEKEKRREFDAIQQALKKIQEDPYEYHRQHQLIINPAENSIKSLQRILASYKSALNVAQLLSREQIAQIVENRLSMSSDSKKYMPRIKDWTADWAYNQE